MSKVKSTQAVNEEKEAMNMAADIEEALEGLELEDLNTALSVDDVEDLVGDLDDLDVGELSEEASEELLGALDDLEEEVEEKKEEVKAKTKTTKSKSSKATKKEVKNEDDGSAKKDVEKPLPMDNPKLTDSLYEDLYKRVTQHAEEKFAEILKNLSDHEMASTKRGAEQNKHYKEYEKRLNAHSKFTGEHAAKWDETFEDLHTKLDEVKVNLGGLEVLLNSVLKKLEGIDYTKETEKKKESPAPTRSSMPEELRDKLAGKMNMFVSKGISAQEAAKKLSEALKGKYSPEEIIASTKP